MTERTDEGRHPAGRDWWWSESWYFDFVAPDGSLGGYVRLGYYPNQKVAWWWACLARAGESLVALRAHDVPVPRTGTEVRDEGLWACITTETPLEHWSVGLEAFAVSLDDPLDAYRGERGDRVAFGLDLEWEAAGPTFDYPGLSRYGQSCDVYGEILVGEERIDFSGSGQRDHCWGTIDWRTTAWCWTAGRLDDGSRFHACVPGVEGPHHAFGYVIDADGTAGSLLDCSAETSLGDEGIPTDASIRLGPLDLHVQPLAVAPLLLTAGDGRISRLPRALCRFTAGDGRAGVGWTEWNQPVDGEFAE